MNRSRNSLKKNMDFKEKKKPDVDNLYRRLGKPGRFHIAIYLMLCCNYFPVVLNHLVMAVYGARTSYLCSMPENIMNKTKVQYGQYSEMEVGRCEVQVTGINGTNESATFSCPAGWNYDVGPAEKNIITEVSAFL